MLVLDRDGVVIDNVPYLADPALVRLTPDIGEAIGRANRAGIPVVVATNQSGIARGLFTWEDFWAVQDRIDEALQASGAALDMVLACGHGPGAADARGGGSHAWRKPGPGMILEACARFQADAAACMVVGDSISDLEAGLSAGLGAACLVATGHGAASLASARWRTLIGQDALRDRIFTAETASEAIVAWLNGTMTLRRVETWS